MNFKSNNHHRKFIATAVTATLVASAAVPVATAESGFTDVSKNYKEAVDYLYENGIVNGLSKTQFGTQQNIKRVDVGVMIAKALLTEEEIEGAPASGFTDVPERAVKYIDALKAKGFVNGKSDTQFAASAPITRGEVALMLANAYDISGDVNHVTFTDVADRYKEAVAALVDNDITQGKKNNRFGTADAITRGELAIFLYKMEMLKEDGEFEVETVEAINTTIDAGAEKQSLSFTVNGKETTLGKLAEAGYAVEFKSTISGIFKDDKTGELDMEKVKTVDSFQYKVVVTKDGQVVESKLATIKVEEFKSVVVSLDEYKLENDGTTLTQNVLVRGEKATITNVKGTSKLGGKISYKTEDLTFESSDKQKLLVSDKGEITTVSAGDAKIIVKVKKTDVSLEIPVKVAAEKRKADQVTTPKQNIGVVANGKLDVPLKVTDQYGEPFSGFQHGDFEVKAGEETIANVSVAPVEAQKGLYKATVSATEKAGTGEFEIKLGDKTALSLPVTVDTDTKVSSYKLELDDAAADHTVDLNPLAEDRDKTLKFLLNQYNKAGIYIGKEENVGTDSGTFKVSTSNDNVGVTVDAAGVITVTGKKAGSAVLTVEQGTVERGKVTVTVEDTTPSIKAVNFAGNKLEKTPAHLDEILPVDGVELTSSGNVEIDYDGGKANLFVDVDGTEGYQANGEDILLGVVEVLSTEITNVSISDDGEIVSGEEQLKKEDKGTVVLTITDNGRDVAVQEIAVDIKEEVQD